MTTENPQESETIDKKDQSDADMSGETSNTTKPSTSKVQLNLNSDSESFSVSAGDDEDDDDDEFGF